MDWLEVEQMPYSEFVNSLKAAMMLDSRRALLDTNIAAYTSMTEKDRSRFFNGLKDGTNKFLDVKLADFKTTVQNLAKRLING